LAVLRDLRSCVTIRCSPIHGVGAFAIFQLRKGVEIPYLPDRVGTDEPQV
jgi:hypothetical protein